LKDIDKFTQHGDIQNLGHICVSVDAQWGGEEFAQLVKDLLIQWNPLRLFYKWGWGKMMEGMNLIKVCYKKHMEMSEWIPSEQLIHANKSV
jgi:hypothetical protein